MTLKKYLNNFASLKDKTIVITGGTSGIGLALAELVLLKEGDVVLLARSLDKAKNVKNALLEKYPSSRIDIIYFDQAKKETILAAAKTLLEQHPDFFALVCNAGIFCPNKNDLGENRVPLTYQTNIIGLTYFLEAISPHLHKEQRVILQGSLCAGFHLKKNISLTNSSTSLFKQYVISKAMVEALFYHYSLKDIEYSIYLTEPGIVSTDIIRNYPRFIRWLGKAFLKLLPNSPKKASLTIMECLKQETVNKAYVCPRGLFTIAGYPKIKKFPKKRERQYLIDLLSKGH